MKSLVCVALVLCVPHVVHKTGNYVQNAEFHPVQVSVLAARRYRRRLLSQVRPQQRSVDRAPSDMLLSFAVWAAPRQSPLPWSDVNLLIVTDVHSWVAAHPHTDHT